MPSSLERAIDELYGRPLSEFIEARKTLAASLKREKHAEDSQRVARLQKPSASAWALNQVYWHARDAWDRLVRAGDRLRTLQQRMLSGRAEDPREAMAERQQAIQAVVERALAFLRASGNAATDATRQRLAVTADAIAAYGSAADAYAPGRMVDDLDPPGFAALASLNVPALRLVKHERTPPAAPPPPQQEAPPRHAKTAARGRQVTREDERRSERERLKAEKEAEAQARAARKEAERQRALAETALTRARESERSARAAAEEQRRAVDAQRRALSALEDRLRVLEQQADAARTARETAERALADASKAAGRHGG